MKNQLEELVEKIVIEDLVCSNLPFTALDISLAVKEVMPTARHREVRNEVVKLFPLLQEDYDFGRTPIDVVDENGNKHQAMLYHSLADSWDLEEVYGPEMRDRSSIKTSIPSVQEAFDEMEALLDGDGADECCDVPSATVISSGAVAVDAPHVQVAPHTTISVINNKQTWEDLFSGVKLFPRS